MRRMVRIAVAAIGVLLLLVGCGGGGPLSGSTWLTQFTNNEGAGVLNDLHIVWDRAVAYGKNDIPPGGSFPAPTVSPDGRTMDFSGADVREGGSCFVTLNYPWEGDDHPNVQQWWWTDAGVRVGPVHNGNPGD